MAEADAKITLGADTTAATGKIQELGQTVQKSLEKIGQAYIGVMGVMAGARGIVSALSAVTAPAAEPENIPAPPITDSFLRIVLHYLTPRLPAPHHDGSAISPLVDMWTQRYLYSAQHIPLEELCCARALFRIEQHSRLKSQHCGIDIDLILTQLRRLIRRRQRQKRTVAAKPDKRSGKRVH